MAPQGYYLGARYFKIAAPSFRVEFVQPGTRTRVKICGITRVEDALSAAEAGADAIGMVFFPGSKRAIGVGQAKAIVAVTPSFVTTVGLFVNPSREDVESVLAKVPLDLLQFHGDESPQFCASFTRPFIKALRMQPEVDLLQTGQQYHDARGLLLDAWDNDAFGGTGKTFDWQRVKPETGGFRIIVAGGLTPDNVAEAITTARPWAVDVSSGVETAPGIKSAALIKRFISEVQRV
ncbi:MAG TPA: phosphoribosylanthranilate isomerase [Candidatus Acidoferrum sp.]|nr:phosphoribosylanthranilate isomerase [Candidatus Acidoferrum sp.]